MTDEERKWEPGEIPAPETRQDVPAPDSVFEETAADAFGNGQFEDIASGAETAVTGSGQETFPVWEDPAVPEEIPPQTGPVMDYETWRAQQHNTIPAYPQSGYYEDWQQASPPQGYYAPAGQQQIFTPVPVKQKKKMSTGLMVFLIVACVFTVAALSGFSLYVLVNHGSANIGGDWIEDGWVEDELPFDGGFPFGNLPFGGDRDDGEGQRPSRPDGSSGGFDRRDDGNDGSGSGGSYDGDGDPTPDFGVTPPDADDPLPEIDTTPTGESITIHKASGRELSAEEVYEKVVQSTVTVASTREYATEVQSGVGTGIVATEDGYIITNSHVVLHSKSTRVNIITSDGQEHDAVVVGVDKTTDLAVLKTDAEDLVPAEFGDSDELAVGQTVFAIGNPGGVKYSGSLTGGYISGLDREAGKYSESGMTYIQTDATINPGNSGGPLVNLYGQVVGINSSKIVSTNYENMSFAIPITKAKAILDQLMNGGYVQGRVRLGITGTDVSNTQYVLFAPQGFMITNINEESAFEGTDAQPGDIITAIDGVTVTQLTEISNELLKYAPGDTITVTLYRMDNGGGDSFDVEITLLEDKGETQQ